MLHILYKYRLVDTIGGPTVGLSSPPIPVKDDVIPMLITLPELADPLDPFDTVAADNIADVLLSHRPGDGTLDELLLLFVKLLVTSVVTELEPVIPFLLLLSISLTLEEDDGGWTTLPNPLDAAVVAETEDSEVPFD